MPREAGSMIGEYELLELVGRGGMAQVYRARHKRSGQIYALKVLLSPAVFDETIGQRFRREAEVLKTIAHPGVVRLVDFGTTSDHRNYLVMEWAEGRQLSDAISREAPFDPARAAEIARRIAAGLGAIHAHDFVHRDLKPQNIMLTGTKHELVKIVDFGLVSGDIQLWERLTRTGEIVGTPLYMAPESIDGRSVDARTDLYSLGVIMYEMLSGDLPFSSQSIPEILDQHLSAKPARLRPMGGIENVTMALLEKNPAMRFIDANAVIAALDALELPTRPGLDLETSPRTPRTRPALASTAAFPHGAKTAEGPLTQPYPVQTWPGSEPSDGGDSTEAEMSAPETENAPDETIRIPIGRAETEFEDSDDTTGFDDPTRALDILPNAPERTSSFTAHGGPTTQPVPVPEKKPPPPGPITQPLPLPVPPVPQLLPLPQAPTIADRPAPKVPIGAQTMAMPNPTSLAPAPQIVVPAPAPTPVRAATPAPVVQSVSLPAVAVIPVPQASAPRPAPSSARERPRARTPKQRKQMIQFLFVLFGAIFATAAYHYVTRRPKVIEIQVPPNRPRAVARPVDTSTVTPR